MFTINSITTPKSITCWCLLLTLISIAKIAQANQPVLNENELISSTEQIMIPNIDSCIGVCLIGYHNNKSCMHLVMTPNNEKDKNNNHSINQLQSGHDWTQYYIRASGRSKAENPFQIFGETATDGTVLTTLDSAFNLKYPQQKIKKVLLFGNYTSAEWSGLVNRDPAHYRIVTNKELIQVLTEKFNLAASDIELHESDRSTDYEISKDGVLSKLHK